MDVCLVLFFSAIILSVARVISEFVFVDPRKLESYQRRITAWRRKAREALRSKDPRLIARVKREKRVIDSLMMELQRMRMRPIMVLMLISLPIFFLIILPYKAAQFYVPLLNRTLSGIWFFVLLSLGVNAIFTIPLKYKGYA